MSKKTKPDIKQLRAIGHKPNPVVTIAGKGLSETVSAELDRALTDHELIKVKITVGSREERAALAEKICKQTGAEMVQSIGSVIVLLRRSAAPDPRLSNLIKPL